MFGWSNNPNKKMFISDVWGQNNKARRLEFPASFTQLIRKKMPFLLSRWFDAILLKLVLYFCSHNTRRNQTLFKFKFKISFCSNTF